MRRVLAGAGLALVLAACASPLRGQSETPQQALTAATQRMSQLHSARFTLHGTVAMTLPPELAQVFNQSGMAMTAPNGTLTVTFTGTGEAQFPDRFHAVVNAALGGVSVKTEEVVAAGKAYIKNPGTGSWIVVSGSAGLSDELSQPDPLSLTQVLDAAKTIKDLGDTTLDGVAVHHYRIVLDPGKLSAKLSSLPAMKDNPQAQAMFSQVLQHGSMTLEVWFGTDDHLVRQIHAVSSVSMDLLQLLGALGAGRGTEGLPGFGISGLSGTTQVTTIFDISYHDFNAPVTVTVPTVG
jgi:hypothetical protein